MDRRIQKTRISIYHALSTLLSRESYDKITIQQIIDTANIGRSTFYAHFETKDDLLKSMLDELFDHVLDHNLHAEATHDFSPQAIQTASSSYQPIMIHFLYHLKEDDSNLSLMLRSKNHNLFWDYLRLQISDFSRHYVLPQLTNICLNKIPRDLLISQVTDSFIRLIKWWIHGGFQETPEQLEQYFSIFLDIKQENYPISPI